MAVRFRHWRCCCSAPWPSGWPLAEQARPVSLVQGPGDPVNWPNRQFDVLPSPTLKAGTSDSSPRASRDRRPRQRRRRLTGHAGRRPGEGHRRLSVRDTAGRPQSGHAASGASGGAGKPQPTPTPAPSSSPSPAPTPSPRSPQRPRSPRAPTPQPTETSFPSPTPQPTATSEPTPSPTPQPTPTSAPSPTPTASPQPRTRLGERRRSPADRGTIAHVVAVRRSRTRRPREFLLSRWRRRLPVPAVVLVVDRTASPTLPPN